MSMVKVSNDKYQVEMNTLEYLVWKDGWNGGSWSNWDVVNNPNDFNFYVVSDDNIIKVEVVIKEEHGVDCDMGHLHDWCSYRVYVKDVGQFGEMLIDIRKLSNGYKFMYCCKC